MHEAFRQFPFGLAEMSVRTVAADLVNGVDCLNPWIQLLVQFWKQGIIADISIKWLVTFSQETPTFGETGGIGRDL